MNNKEITEKSATELVSLIKNKELKVTEVVLAFLEQIEEVNPKVNAIVTLLPKEEILKKTEESDRKIQNNEKIGIS